MDKTPETLRKILDAPSSKEVATLVSSLIKAVRDTVGSAKDELKSFTEKAIHDAPTFNTKNMEDMYNKLARSEANLKSLVSDIEKRLSNETYRNISNEVYKLEQAIRNVPQFDSKPLEAKWARVVADLGGKIGAIKPFILKPTAVRDALETLEGEDRLDASAIKGLEKLIKKHSSKVFVGGGGTGGGKVVKIYDISASLNGVAKTFTLPAAWRVLAVHASSFPFSAFRPTTDFTWTPTSITFTSEIDAASTLATGQSVLIEYAEA